MMKSKKMILGTLGTMAIVAAPIAAVVSCGSKSTEEMSALDKALMEVSKPMELKEYKAFIIKTISENFWKDDKKTALASTDFDEVNKAKDSGAAKTAANGMKGLFKKEKAAVNTVVTVNGQDIELGAFVADTSMTVSTAGSAAVEAAAAVTEVDATSATQADVDALIDAAADVEAIKAILAKYTTDNKNTTEVVVTSITGQGSDAKVLEAAKTAAKKLTATLFNKDYVEPKAEVKAKAAVNTVVTIGGKTHDLGQFVKTPKLTVKEAGSAAVALEAGTPTIKDMVTLPDYITALKEVFKNFTKDEKGTSFNDADLKTITDAKSADAALKAAKAIKVYTA
ncbi:MAG: hypothetical protein GY679_04585 [Mycoplasma sp.]|nr:hypothetical protein [Mycoplasma sp.]